MTAIEAFVDGADLPDAGRLLRDPTLGASGRALVEALIAGDADRVDDLLARDPPLARRAIGGTPLAELAVATGDPEIVRTVLARGASPDPAGDGAPLILALHARAPDLAVVLLEADASPTPPAAVLEPMRAVIALGSPAGVRLLLDYGADANVSGPLARRPLHVALDMEQFAIVELLLDRGADPWALDASGANLATAAATPMLSDSPHDAAAQARLAGRAKALGWPQPLPTPRELADRAARGDWPPRSR